MRRALAVLLRHWADKLDPHEQSYQPPGERAELRDIAQPGPITERPEPVGTWAGWEPSGTEEIDNPVRMRVRSGMYL